MQGPAVGRLLQQLPVHVITIYVLQVGFTPIGAWGTILLFRLHALFLFALPAIPNVQSWLGRPQVTHSVCAVCFLRILSPVHMPQVGRTAGCRGRRTQFCCPTA